VRYSQLSFQIDKTDAPVDIDVPNVAYQYIDPGLAFRLPLAGGTVAVSAEARLALVTASGEIQEVSQYGAASMLGLDGDLGLEYRVMPRLGIRGGVRYTGISFAFDGSGELTNRDADAEPDVSGALDRYLGGYLVAGYSF
jgi:hypothetical protein